MTSTVENARDEMYALAKTAFEGRCELVYDDAKAKKPNGPDPWARATVRHTNGGESSISRGNGKGRYTRIGTLYLNLFAPPGDGLRVLDPLVKVALDAYEGKTTPSGIWFTKAQVREMGVVNGLAQVNVLVNFSYDEVK
jgi:hypothetical protein